MESKQPQEQSTHLLRRFGLLQATALNMSNMIGIGPFITIPLLMSALGGPQAMLGWFIAVLIAIPDGMVWSELGASMPGFGRDLPVSARGLRPRNLRSVDGLPVHLAIHLQRSPRDRIRLHRFRKIHRICVAVGHASSNRVDRHGCRPHKHCAALSPE